jgi:D-glycero-D-manno-heptose 1,7-bisphosphate phosphatase
MKGVPVKAVFLDRDGVITIPEFRDGRSFAPRSLAAFKMYPETQDCLQKLYQAGFIIIVVTNQPDVGHGHVSRGVVEAMHAYIFETLPVTSIECCYHRQNEKCACRKPNSGMIVRAAEKYEIDLSKSVMVGDRGSDVEAGRSAGCHTVFIDRGYSEPLPRHANVVVNSLAEATEYILALSMEINTAYNDPGKCLKR